MPAKLWEAIPLDKNYTKALAQIDEHLIYWPKHMIHKCKQRFTRITQYLIRMRKLRKQENQRTPERVHKKVERRDRVREGRAEKVAQIENKIKKELLGRLKQGTYSEIYNFDEKMFNSVLDDEAIEDDTQQQQKEQEEDMEMEYVADEDLDNDFVDENDVEDFNDFLESGFDGTDFTGDDEEDDEDKPASKPTKTKPAPPKGGKGKRSHLQIEYEDNQKQKETQAEDEHSE